MSVDEQATLSLPVDHIIRARLSIQKRRKYAHATRTRSERSARFKKESHLDTLSIDGAEL